MTQNETLLTTRINRRQALKIAGGTAAAAVLAACGGAAKPTPKPGVATSAPAAKQYTVTFWRSPYDTRAPIAIEALDKFYKEQMPAMLPENVTVNTVEIAEAPFDKIQASIGAGTPPDVAWVDQTWVAPLLALNALNAMPEDLIDVEKSFGSFANDFFRVGSDKKVYILPWGIWERGVFYNIDLLKEYGYEPSDLPKKISDMILFCQELTQWEEGQTEPKLAAWPLAGGTTFDFYTAVVDNLGGFWWLDDTTSGFGEPEWEEAWTLTMAMFDVFKLDAREGLDAIDRFYNGKAFFLPQQLWVGNVLRRDWPNINWGIMTHPTPSGGPPYGWKEWHTGWGNLSIQKGEALNAAWQVWKAVYSPEWTRANALGANYIPGRLEAQGKPPFTEDNPQWAGAIEKHKPGNSVCPGYWPAELWKTSNEAFEAVYKGGADIHDSLQQAKQAADVVLANSPEIQETILTKKDYEAHPSWTDGKIPIKPWWDGKRGSYLTPEQAAQLP